MFSGGRKAAFVFLVIMVLFTFGANALFAGSVGRIKGTVTDKKTGEPLFGVSVSIEGTTMGAKTDLDGNFIILSVPPGEFSIKFSLLSYKTSRIEGIRVDTDQTTERNIQLEETVLETGEVITVTGERAMIDFNQTGTVSIKTQKEIKSAPVADIGGLLERETGIIKDAEGELHIRGGRSGETTYMVDGVNYSDPLGGRAPVDAGINISSSAVLELQVIKDGFDPEYGEALSGVVKITSPSGKADQTRTNLEYYTDDFGSANLNRYSENYDQIDFTVSGPDPFFTNRVLPALGINYFEGKDFTYYLYARVLKTDTRNPYWRYSTSETQKVYDGIEILGIDISDRQENTYNFDATLAYNPTSNMTAKLFYKGMWLNKTIFSWLYRYTPDTAPIYEYNTNTLALQLKQVLSKTTDYEINLSYWGSRFEEMPGDPDHPGQGLTPDQFLYRDEYEKYDDYNNNGVYDASEPFLNVFPDSTQYGSIYVPYRNSSDISYLVDDDQVGGSWYPMYDINNNGVMDQYEGEPFVDLNGNGVWDIGDPLTSDINGNGTYDDYYRDVTSVSETSGGEPYIDGDSSLGEPFTDVNRNGVYDAGVDIFVTAFDEDINDDKDRNNAYTPPSAFYWSPGIDYIDYNGNGVFDFPNGTYDPGEPFVDENKNGVYDDAGDNGSAFLLYGFGASGDDYYTFWTEEKVDKYTLKGNLKKAIGSAHEIKTGFEFRSEKISVANIQGLDQYNTNEDDGYPYPGRGTVRDFYSRNPKILVLFMRDKIEYGSLVASLGLRADMFFQSDLTGTSTILDELGIEPEDLRSKISPRVSINYPISDRAMIRFNYGHFYELPSYSRMYRMGNPDITGADDLAGNPNLDYTKTVNYTFGVNYAFTEEYSLKISGYYKDYFNMINVSTNYDGRRFSYYDNTDYARVRGFELEIEREASRFIFGRLSYEYSFAYGKSSSDSENYELLAALDQIAIDENPLDWDIRHRVAVWIQMYFTHRDHPKLFGLSIPNDWDLSVYWSYQTGFPYTPGRDYPGLVLDVGESALTNSMRLPSTAQTDVKLNKRFRISGISYSIKLWVYNLFDNKNVLSVYGDTGRADTNNNIDEVIGGGTEREASPTYYGRGRQIIFGLGINF